MRLVSRALAAAALCLGLVACGETDKERARRHDELCRSYGAQPGTTDYIHCRATIHTTEYRQEQEAVTAAVLASSAAGAASASAAASAAAAGRR